MPLDPGLLMLGEGAWAPGQQCALLWDHLRVLMLHSLFFFLMDELLHWATRHPPGGIKERRKAWQPAQTMPR
jgi:hypothetical protein